MIEVIFVIHAGGKIRTAGGSVESLPESGQTITVKGIDHTVRSVMETFVGTTQRLPKPEIDIDPLA
jgi:hypothetical protein